ncbi:MAG TPA: ROK family protein, partial [Limnochorda sp.]
MATGKPVVGVDVGGTNVRAAVFDPATWRWLAPPRRRALAEGAGQVVDLIAQTVRQAVGDAGLPLEAIGGVGVGFPGIVDPGAGRSLYAVNLPEWKGGPVRAWLEARLGLPVQVENDVRAGGLAEFRLGAGKGRRSMVYVSVGTGIGGALFVEGRRWLGATFQAGEIGHMVLDPSEAAPLCRCGQRGDAEAYLSGRAIEEAARRSLGLGLSAGEVLEA